MHRLTCSAYSWMLLRSPNKLDARNIHRHHKRGAEAAVKHRDGHVVVHGRDGVAAQHGGVFAQLLQRKAERRARADGVTVRVFMAQNQDVICSKQTRNNGLAIYSSES